MHGRWQANPRRRDVDAFGRAPGEPGYNDPHFDHDLYLLGLYNPPAFLYIFNPISLSIFLLFYGNYVREKERLRWKAVKCSTAERRALRRYINTVVRHDAHRLESADLDTQELTCGADEYLNKLQDLFVKLSDGGGALTRASWDEACGAGRHASVWDTLSGEHGEHHEHDIATILFRAADLDHDERLSFKEFVTIAVAAAAAHEGDVEAQAELLFMLIDEDHSGTLDHGELERFVQRAVRLGVLKIPERMDGVLIDHRAEERHLAEHIAREVWERGSRDGATITREGFGRIAPRLLCLDLQSLPKPLDGSSQSSADFHQMVEHHRNHYYHGRALPPDVPKYYVSGQRMYGGEGNRV